MDSGRVAIRPGSLLRIRYKTIGMVAEGEGAEGPTYLATDMQGQQVSCRDVGPAHAAAAAEYHDTLHAVRELSHPHLAPIIDSFAHAGREYIVMEALPGQTLDTILQAAVAPSRRRIHALLHQLCMVLAYVDGKVPAFIFDRLRANEIKVDAAGHISLDSYRLGRCFEAVAVPIFSTTVEDRAHNYELLADLMVNVLEKTHRGVEGRRHDPRFTALVKRLRDFALHPGYNFVEVSRSLGSAMGTGILVTGQLTEPLQARRTTEELYASKTAFTGIDRDGRPQSGTLQADTLNAAVATLRSRGLKVDDVHFETPPDRLLERLRRIPRLPLGIAMVALCLGGAAYTIRHGGPAVPVPVHSRMLVAEADGTLQNINPATLQISLVGKLPGPVSDLKVLAGGTVLAVVSSAGHGLSFVRTDNARPVVVLHPWLDAVDKLLVSPQRNVLYCIGKQRGSIAVMAATDLSLKTTINVSGPIGDAALSTDGKRLYVSLPELNTIDVLDAERGTVVTSFGVAGGPIGLGISRQRELWVGCRQDVLKMVALDDAYRSIGIPCRFNDHLVAFAFPPQGPGYVLCDDGSISPMSGSSKGSSVSGDGPGGMVCTLGGQGELWVSSGRGAELHVLDVVHHGPDRRISLPSRPVAIDYAP